MKNLYKIEDELYIVSSSEKIKENTQSFKQGLNGDWFYNTIYNFIARTGDITPYDFKIILTTNKLLIKDGVQAIDDEFLEYYVSVPFGEIKEVEVDDLREISNEFIELDTMPYKIIIPKKEPKHPKVFSENGDELFFDEQGNLIKEEPKQECIATKNMHLDAKMAYDSLPKKAPFKHKCEVLSKEYIMENRSNAYDFIDFDKQETLEELGKTISQKDADKDSFEDVTKYKKERSYSEEELKHAFFSGCQSERQIKPRIKCWEEWFEQFKNK